MPAANSAVTEIEALLDVDVGTHLSSDLEETRYADLLTAGSTGYQLVAVPSSQRPSAGGEPNSNETETEIALLFRLVHRLSDPSSERPWSRTTLFAFLEDKLLKSSYWKTASVYEVIEPPSLDFPGDIEREGQIIRVTLTLVVSVQA